MNPDYYICDRCEKEKVEKINRVHLFNGYNDLGEQTPEVLDLCPACMADLVSACVKGPDYVVWIKGH